MIKRITTCTRCLETETIGIDDVSFYLHIDKVGIDLCPHCQSLLGDWVHHIESGGDYD